MSQCSLLVLPKVIEDGLSAVPLLPPSNHMAWHKVFYLKHTLHMHSSSSSQLKSPLFNFFKKLPIQKIIHEYLAQAYPQCAQSYKVALLAGFLSLLAEFDTHPAKPWSFHGYHTLKTCSRVLLHQHLLNTSSA